MAADRKINRGSEGGAPVFVWDAPEVFLRLNLEEQRASLERLEASVREPWLRLLEEDSRKGRRELARRLRNAQEKIRRLEDRWRSLSDFDRRMSGGFRLAGVDEVGRGPLAGPVTAAAVILPPGFHAPGLDDSKVLSETAREVFAERIREEALSWALADRSAEEVDRLGIRNAVMAVMTEALAKLQIEAKCILVDGRETPEAVTGARAIIDGDAKSLSVAAASVIAKVHRDGFMREAHTRFPEYGFADNKGYGSPDHIAALRRIGPCPLHRRSFLGRILSGDAARAGRGG